METPIGDSSIEMGFQTWRWIWCNVNATISPAYHLGTDRHGCTHAFDRCRQICRAADVSGRTSVSETSSAVPRQSSTIQRFAASARLAATDDNDYRVSYSRIATICFAQNSICILRSNRGRSQIARNQRLEMEGPLASNERRFSTAQVFAIGDPTDFPILVPSYTQVSLEAPSSNH